MALRSSFPLEKPSRVLLAGDWHGNTDRAIAAVQWGSARGAEGILQLGDFGIWAGSWGGSYIKTLNRELNRRGMWLGFVDGNHENFDLLESMPLRRGVRPVAQRITHLPRTYRWTWGEVTWLALGGAVSMDANARRPHVSWWPREAITAGEAWQATLGGPVQYMLTHDAPAGVDVPGLLDIWPADAMRAADRHRAQLREVAKSVLPDVIFHGHMHARYSQTVSFDQESVGKPTKVIGLASDHEPLAQNLLVVDLDARGFVVLPQAA